VAKATTGLSREAVDFVDRHLAVTGRRNRIANVNAVVHEARCQWEPDQALAVEQLALEARGVSLDHRQSTATTTVLATMDTPDALDLDASLSELATTTGRLGDDRAYDVRRASALGMLARPQRVLDLMGSLDKLDHPNRLEKHGLDKLDQPIGTRATLYLHVDASDRAEQADPDGHGVGCGTVEKLGAATLDLLRDWLARTDHVTVRPVLDLSRADSVDRHDPPAWMRELVALRDPHCVFPGCGRDARSCDLDHVERYVDPDTGGPPGQTQPDNLAPLCRRHHHTKTHHGWSYRRATDETDPDPDDPVHRTAYDWTTPSGRTYRVVTWPQ
jgi:hypothetical protein